MSTHAQTQNQTILVLGATGGIGGAVASAFKAHGFKVKAMHRNAAAQAGLYPDYQWIAGDAMNADDVLAAAAGADFIFHGVNPPGYKNWDTLALPMLENTIAAAHAHHACVLFPGTLYNFGRDVLPEPREDSPQNATTRKGRIRIAMEARLGEAAKERTPVILVRAGDFFGPHSGNSWFSQMVAPAKPVRAVTQLGKPDVGHQWAYLPDLAETFVRLAERVKSLPSRATFHFEGFWDADGTQMAKHIAQAAGRPDVKVRRFPWFVVPLLAPFVTLMREVKEVAYLWHEPVHMKNDRLVAALGAEPRTPIDIAVHEALTGLGCIDGEQADVKSIKGQARTA